MTHHNPAHPYHAQRREIMQLCIDSMRRGADGVQTELVIWDNGSPPEYRAFLRSLEPDTLIESPNVGPHNARLALCHIARGEIVNLSDDDILYRPGWLAAMLEIMRTYPNVAVVSGSPMNTEFRRNFQPAHEWAKDNPAVTVTTGRDLIPDKWERAAALSVGSTIYPKRYDETLLEYNGVQAWAMAHHMQMLGPRDILARFMRRTGDIIQFWDIADEISHAGYLQLTTANRTAVHIGNVIDKSVKEIMQEWQIT